MNKKLALPIVAILALSIGVWGMGNMYARAAPATVEVGFACGLFDGDGGVALAFDTHLVTTVNKNGVVNMTCHVENVPNNTGAAVRYNADNNPAGPGTLCASGALTTSSWKETVSDNGDGTGDATLQCKFRV